MVVGRWPTRLTESVKTLGLARLKFFEVLFLEVKAGCAVSFSQTCFGMMGFLHKYDKEWVPGARPGRGFRGSPNHVYAELRLSGSPLCGRLASN